MICILLALWTFRRQILSESFYEKLQLSIAEMSLGAEFPLRSAAIPYIRTTS